MSQAQTSVGYRHLRYKQRQI